jgi:large conductance mechanosensitive channel
MGMMSEFKDFAMKGNVVDMAVGIVIGGAFGKIVSSFVGGVVMPALSPLLGGINFSDLKYVMSEAVMGADGAVTTPEVAINYGSFVQTIIDFIIIAFAIFMVVKQMNRLKKKEEEAPAPDPGPTAEELLMEIRDALKK